MLRLSSWICVSSVLIVSLSSLTSLRSASTLCCISTNSLAGLTSGAGAPQNDWTGIIGLCICGGCIIGCCIGIGCIDGCQPKCAGVGSENPPCVCIGWAGVLPGDGDISPGCGGILTLRPADEISLKPCRGWGVCNCSVMFWICCDNSACRFDSIS